jgi:drug/metabolite transporter (DMT)-like permease
MTPQEFGLLLLSVMSGVAGQFFLKTGALKLGRVTAGNAIALILNIPSTPELLIGLMFYGMGAISYILLLTRVKLSIVGPSVALSYIFSVLLGYFIFKESLPFERLIGLGLISAGVLMVVWQWK